MEEKIDFWQDLDGLIESVSKQERTVLGAEDLYGHVGEGNIGDEEITVRYNAEMRNKEGLMIVGFVKRMDLEIVNTYFKKDEQGMRYKSGEKSFQVDYMMCRRRNFKKMCNCKVMVNVCRKAAPYGGIQNDSHGEKGRESKTKDKMVETEEDKLSRSI